jgi:hypothetical protein
MMRALDLDFARRRSGGPAGWAMLIAGVVAAALLVVAGQRYEEELVQHRSVVRRAEQALPGAGRPAASAAEAKAQEAVLAEVRRVGALLDLPWAELFAALESIGVADVALLSLSPDARKQQVRISAEARNLEAMLDFHHRLEQTAAFRDVSLINHEIVEQAPERPVRFNLAAGWAIDNARP